MNIFDSIENSANSIDDRFDNGLEYFKLFLERYIIDYQNVRHDRMFLRTLNNFWLLLKTVNACNVEVITHKTYEISYFEK